MGVEMNTEAAVHPSDDEVSRTDWSAQVRLGFVISVFAALSAVALAGHLSETVIVLGIIVLATVASWYQMERPVLEPALTRSQRH
jgi:hypothetical protein